MSGRVAEEQAALREVATLVAEGVPADELFAVVTKQAGRLFAAAASGVIRFDGDTEAVVMGTWGEVDVPLGTRFPVDGADRSPMFLRTAEPGRIEWSQRSGPVAETVRTQLGFTSTVGAPILVEGRVWGTLMVHVRHGEALPPETELRLGQFANLVATAILNAQVREELHLLADEQAALRLVATLVARERPPAEVFETVATEMGHLLGVEDVALMRYEQDQTATVVGRWGERRESLAVGTRMPLDGTNVTALVYRTSQSARIDDYGTATGHIGAHLRGVGTRAAVGAPIIVNGRLWGVMVAAQGIQAPLPAEIETRLEKFAELTATAIANAQAREDLAASRARIVAATDAERRRVVRDLHDGAQQRLVHTLVTLKVAQQAIGTDEARAAAFLGEAVEHAERAIGELRELAHGILPAVLSRGGLRAGVRALAQRSQVPVDVQVTEQRLSATVEATAYFVVAEALTNVAKHAHATRATVTAQVADARLLVEIRDDGVGGARLEGAGLGGLADRLVALDGTLRVESPFDAGTLVAAEIPLAERRVALLGD